MATTKVYIDYELPGQHPGVTELRPVMSVENGAYCCMSGRSPVDGIFGFGLSEDEALLEWVKSYERKK